MIFPIEACVLAWMRFAKQFEFVVTVVRNAASALVAGIKVLAVEIRS